MTRESSLTFSCSSTTRSAASNAPLTYAIAEASELAIEVRPICALPRMCGPSPGPQPSGSLTASLRVLLPCNQPLIRILPDTLHRLPAADILQPRITSSLPICPHAFRGRHRIVFSMATSLFCCLFHRINVTRYEKQCIGGSPIIARKCHMDRGKSSVNYVSG